MSAAVDIVNIASQIKTPLALGGLTAAFVFLGFRQIVARDIFPRLNELLGAEILKSIINKLFYLALVAMCLGFIAYALPLVLPAIPRPGPAAVMAQPEPVTDVARPPVSSFYFEFNRAALTPASKAQAERLATWLIEHKDLNVLLRGYSNVEEVWDVDHPPEGDSHGFRLGQERANAVANALRELGVDSTRVSTVSNGNQQVPDFRDTAEARAIDRSVQVVISKR